MNRDKGKDKKGNVLIEGKWGQFATVNIQKRNFRPIHLIF